MCCQFSDVNPKLSVFSESWVRYSTAFVITFDKKVPKKPPKIILLSHFIALVSPHFSNLSVLQCHLSVSKLLTFLDIENGFNS